jgi:hypothetical protein
MFNYARERAGRTVERMTDRIVEKIDDAAYRAEKRFRRTLESIGGIIAFYLLLVLSVVFLSLALFYLFRDILLFQEALSYLIIAVIVFVIGLLIRIKFREGRNGKRDYETDERYC